MWPFTEKVKFADPCYISLNKCIEIYDNILFVEVSFVFPRVLNCFSFSFTICLYHRLFIWSDILLDHLLFPGEFSLSPLLTYVLASFWDMERLTESQWDPPFSNALQEKAAPDQVYSKYFGGWQEKKALWVNVLMAIKRRDTSGRPNQTEILGGWGWRVWEP